MSALLDGHVVAQTAKVQFLFTFPPTNEKEWRISLFFLFSTKLLAPFPLFFFQSTPPSFFPYFTCFDG